MDGEMLKEVEDKLLEEENAGEVSNNPVADSDEQKEQTTCNLKDPIAVKCTEAFAQIWPDEELHIDKERIIALFKVVLGDLFNDDLAVVLINNMAPDAEGNISLHNFFQAFSLDCWSPESLAVMQQVIESAPEVINKLADWKTILATLGFDLCDSEVESLILKVQQCAAAVLNIELANVESNANDVQDEIEQRSLRIIEILSNKLKKTSIVCENKSLTSDKTEDASNTKPE